MSFLLSLVVCNFEIWQVVLLRYVDAFSQISDKNGKLDFAKFEVYLKEILKVQ